MLLYRNTRQRVRELVSEVRRSETGVRIDGEGDIADICRLTCMEQGVPVVTDETAPLLAVRGMKVSLLPPPEHRKNGRGPCFADGEKGMTQRIPPCPSMCWSPAARVTSAPCCAASCCAWAYTLPWSTICSLAASRCWRTWHTRTSTSPKPMCASRVRLRNALRSDWPRPDAVIHLAAIVGFPACQAVGRQVAWRYNVEATERVFERGSGDGRTAHRLRLYLQQLRPLRRRQARHRGIAAQRRSRSMPRPRSPPSASCSGRRLAPAPR